MWREMTYRSPVVQLRVLKNGNLRVGTILSFIMGFGLYGTTFIIPLYVQATLGWTATQAGLLLIPSALTTAFMMPLIGRILQKGFPQQYLVSIGMLIFFFFCFWGYKVLSPSTGQENFFWMLIMRGMGMGMLFIPITALSLSTLKGRQIGDGAAFTGMMRQLGGSFGIAIITTFMAHTNMIHRSTLVGHLDRTSLSVQNNIQGMQQGFMAKGYPENTALQMAYMALDSKVNNQAQILSYMDVFLYIGVAFLICIPFVLLVRKKKQEGKLDLSSAH
jgi:MFS transporter, DHA2 family, multidrug resistance protein